MTAIVFAGPSIHGFDEAIRGGVEIRPPAACGDILRACGDGPARIGLIDGIFESGPSTWHKEILFALSAGIEVFGAASMGALRAAECHHFGMQGERIFSSIISENGFRMGYAPRQPQRPFTGTSGLGGIAPAGWRGQEARAGASSTLRHAFWARRPK